MAKQKRWLWVGMLGIVMAMAASSPRAQAGGDAGAGAAVGGGGGIPLAQMAERSASGALLKVGKGESPILMAGGMQGAWLCVPRMISEGENEKAGASFELWYHARGASEKGRDTWRRASFEGGPYCRGIPQGFAAVPGKIVDAEGRSQERLSAYVLFDDYWLRAFSLEHAPVKMPLRKDQEGLAEKTLKGVAIAGTSKAVFVLAHGPMGAAATQAASSPATATATATTSAAAGPRVWQIIAHHDGETEELSPIGVVGAADGSTPSEKADPVLVATGNRLILAWREPGDTQRLRTRVLAARVTPPAASAPASAPATRSAAEWSAVHVVDVGEDIPRLMGTTVDGRVVLAWAAKHEGGTQYDLRGVVVEADGSIAVGNNGKARQGPMFPMQLGAMSEGISPQTDISLAPSGTALYVVAYGPDNKIRTRMYPGDSPAAGGEAQEIEAATGVRNDSDIVQNVMLYLLIALVAVSLWQWRTRPKKVTIPKGHILAPLGKRVLAGAIDLAIPLVLVVMYESFVRGGEGGGGMAGGVELLKAWFMGFVQPAKVYAEFPILLWAMGGFLVHVTVGEIASGRSIGKSIVGTRVVSIDGLPARGMSIFLRNFVKVFELTTGVLLVYVLISEHRQRLGDLLAQTIVVEPGIPDEPGEKKRKADRERDEAGTK